MFLTAQVVTSVPRDSAEQTLTPVDEKQLAVQIMFIPCHHTVYIYRWSYSFDLPFMFLSFNLKILYFLCRATC